MFVCNLTIVYQSHQVPDILSSPSLLVPWHPQLTQTVNEVPVTDTDLNETTRLASTIVDIQQCTPFFFLQKQLQYRTSQNRLLKKNVFFVSFFVVVIHYFVTIFPPIVLCGSHDTAKSFPILHCWGQCIVDRQQCTVGSGQVVCSRLDVCMVPWTVVGRLLVLLNTGVLGVCTVANVLANMV